MAMWVCPHCWGENLNYGSIELESESAFFPRVCEDCWAEWNEWYELSYYDQEVVSYPDDLSNNQKENDSEGTNK